MSSYSQTDSVSIKDKWNCNFSNNPVVKYIVFFLMHGLIMFQCSVCLILKQYFADCMNYNNRCNHVKKQTQL